MSERLTHVPDERLADLRGDFASSQRGSESARAGVDPQLIDQQLVALERDGWLICESLLTPDELAQLRDEVVPLLDCTVPPRRATSYGPDRAHAPRPAHASHENTGLLVHHQRWQFV
ncbi:MAG: phytanoyl-CoA dioxygenase family protein [Myxococcaceae bacterium]|nr:phytanoyl-CoA dioxygenase family protein [Myxococcaceae bacterium]